MRLAADTAENRRMRLFMKLYPELTALPGPLDPIGS